MDDVKRECSFEGCERAKVANGLCQAHRAQQLRGKPLSPIRRYLNNTVSKICSFEPCERTARTRGLCDAHYTQMRRHKELAPLEPHTSSSETQCSFVGCGKKKTARGLCSGHYDQQLRGIELRPLRRYRDGAQCLACDEPTPARATFRDVPLCDRHYQRALYHTKKEARG